MTTAIALKGWTKTQLAERSGVGRPTIDNWRTNPKPPQARSVNAVADALGIPRERALRLAGIIADGEPDGRPPPTPLDEELGEEKADLVRRAIRRVRPGDADKILADIEGAFRQRAEGSGG